MKHKLASLTLLSLLLVLPILIGTVNVQAQNNSYITIKPTTADSQFYTSAGNNWTLTFMANWSFGSQNGQPVQNATAKIDVRNSEDTLLETLTFNTTTGVFSFNYSSETADILTFTPTSLTTQQSQEYTVDETTDAVYGLTSEPITVWYDTFHVSPVSFNTDSLGKTVATVNVTYLLVPEEGLTLHNQTYSKIVHNAKVTINGVEATETSSGISTAESSSCIDTAYVNVKVSQEGWTTTETAFSFAHNANQQVWMYGVAFVSVAAFATVGLHYAVYRKANNSSKHSGKLFFGFILLMVSSMLSLYWGVVAVEGVMHTFDWFLFALACLFSSIFGLVGSMLVLRKKLQPLAIFAPVVPLIINTVIAKSALDSYQLATPWLMLLFSTILSAVCIFFVSSSNDAFLKPTQAT
ncbi:MAG: hypothetical protein ACFCUE_09630 [Candidatus Bathyarchaeia archaeon]